MKYFILLILLCSVTLSCKNETKTDKQPKLEVIENKALKFENLPALPTEQLQQLYASVSYIDYIFYDLPFSISQDNRPSITSNLQLISQEKLGGITSNCKPIGREFFHIDGNIAYEAEIYFQEGCYGYIFLNKEKPIYANKVSPSGMKFYNNIIAQAEQLKKKALNGG